MLKSYSSPTPWQGRVDEPQNNSTLRWHQKIKLFDLENGSPRISTKNPSYALLGFESEEGVRLNQGRLGAKDGPQAIRKMMTNFPVHKKKDFELFDAGNIVCETAHLEDAQKVFGDAVTQILNKKLAPLVLGGGHETAWGHYQGLRKVFPKKKIGIVNFDGHFDMRPLTNGGNSGTPFLQIAEDCKKRKIPFPYFVIGIQESANTEQLFETAKTHKAQYLLARDVCEKNISKISASLKSFAKKCDLLYITICLDVFAQAFAPGVSSPTALGIDPRLMQNFLSVLKSTKKVASLDVVELAPCFDRDNQTARLAANLIFTWVNA